MFILGIIAACGMGLVLSLLGAGGSILTLPILVYLFNISVVDATSYSLLLVGVTAGFSFFVYLRQKLVDLKVGIIFGIPSIIGVVLARKVLVPYLPETLNFLSFSIPKSFVIMATFSILMLVSATLMIRDRKLDLKAPEKQKAEFEKNVIIVLEGLIVGQLTGFVGAGGGFLIIPALVLLTGLDMKIAIGTSLFIIAVKSLAGFGSDVMDGFQTDWLFSLYVILATFVGVLIGNILSKKATDKTLKRYFGYMTLIIGSFIILDQLINL